MAQINVILWDVDGTLLDFSAAERRALEDCFRSFQMCPCTPELLARYSQINRTYWRRLERGELTKPQVLLGRFEEFFAQEGLNCRDIPAFNQEYQLRLGDTVVFRDDAGSLVARLKGRVRQYAVTNGTRVDQERKLSRSGRDRMLDGIFIAEMVGTEKPGAAFFDAVFSQIGPCCRDEVMIVGDSLTSDMQGGRSAGILCCWYNPLGEPRPADPRIDYDIRDLRQVEQTLDRAGVETISCDEMKEIYGELKFDKLYEDRPYTYTSLVTSIDGRIAFTDAPQGPLIAKLNQYDGDGAGADWWILNMLRAVSDGDIIGAGTMNAESDYTAHVFSRQLEDDRVAAGMQPGPWNFISSLDAHDIPFDHLLFKTKEVPVIISTSASGIPVIQENMKEDYYLTGPVHDISEVTGEMIEAMKANRDKILVIATGDKATDSKEALYIMKKFGLDKLLVETPSYMHYLVSQKMMDELFFNYSCIYVGGQALTIGKYGQEFGSKDHPHTRMLSIHSHSDHFFYFRHKLIYG